MPYACRTEIAVIYTVCQLVPQRGSKLTQTSLYNLILVVKYVFNLRDVFTVTA